MDGAPSEGCSTTTILAQLSIERDAGAGAVHHVVESLMRVRRVSQLKSCGVAAFAPRLHGRRPEGSVRSC
jgi:hypothetical protein